MTREDLYTAAILGAFCQRSAKFDPIHEVRTARKFAQRAVAHDPGAHVPAESGPDASEGAGSLEDVARKLEAFSDQKYDEASKLGGQNTVMCNREAQAARRAAAIVRDHKRAASEPSSQAAQSAAQQDSDVEALRAERDDLAKRLADTEWDRDWLIEACRSIKTLASEQNLDAYDRVRRVISTTIKALHAVETTSSVHSQDRYSDYAVGARGGPPVIRWPGKWPLPRLLVHKLSYPAFWLEHEDGEGFTYLGSIDVPKTVFDQLPSEMQQALRKQNPRLYGALDQEPSHNGAGQDGTTGDTQ